MPNPRGHETAARGDDVLASRLHRPFLPVGLVLLAVVVLFLGSHAKELHGTPTFYASMAREIVEARDPFVLFEGEAAYFLKPPLVIWATALSQVVFGFSNFAATLIPRLAALACVLLLYVWLARSAGETVAWYGSVAMLVNSTFVQFSTTLRMDSMLLLGILMSVSALWMRTLTAASGNLFGGLAIGLMSKGPIALLVVPLVGWLLSLNRATRRRIDWRWSLLLLVPLAWYCYLAWSAGAAPARDLLDDIAREGAPETAGRLRPYLETYVVMPARRYWPFYPFMLVGIALAAFPRLVAPHAALTKFLVCWLGLILLLCAFKPDPDIRYLYPALPALAGLAGIALRSLGGARIRRVLDRVLFAVAIALVAVAVAPEAWLDKPRMLPRDTREAVAEIRRVTDEYTAPAAPVHVLGPYPYRANASRRQHTQRDWVHYYLGRPVAIVANDVELRAAGAPTVLLTGRSHGYEASLRALGYEPLLATKEMVLAARSGSALAAQKEARFDGKSLY